MSGTIRAERQDPRPTVVTGSVFIILVLKGFLALPASGQGVNCRADLRALTFVIQYTWAFKYYSVGEGFVTSKAGVRDELRRGDDAETPEACAEVIERFLARLNDGHADLQYFPGVEHTAPAIFFQTERRDDPRFYEDAKGAPFSLYVVDRDSRDESLQDVTPGSELVAVDGVRIDSIYQIALMRSSGSTYRWRDHVAGTKLLRGPEGSTVDLTLRDPVGRTREATVVRPPYTRQTFLDMDTTVNWDSVKVVRATRLEGGWGYLSLWSFLLRDSESAAAAIDAAIDSILDGPGIIIDLRGNSGGFIRTAADVAGRFVAGGTLIGYTYQLPDDYKKKIRFEGWAPTEEPDTAREPLMATPRGEIYLGPLVLIIDEGCFSACELFAGGLQASGRAFLVGRATGGGGGIATALELPSGAVVSFSWSVAWLPNGELIEGRGVLPDVYVKNRPRDWAVGGTGCWNAPSGRWRRRKPGRSQPLMMIPHRWPALCFGPGGSGCGAAVLHGALEFGQG